MVRRWVTAMHSVARLGLLTWFASAFLFGPTQTRPGVACAETQSALAATASGAAAATPQATSQQAQTSGLAFGSMPERFADVRKDGADVFATIDDIKAGTPTAFVNDKTFVAISPRARTLTVDGVKYYKTDQGYIARTQLSWYSPSSFAGIVLPASPQPLVGQVLAAWAVPRKPGSKLRAFTAPSARATVAREVTSRELVTPQTTEAGFAQIAADTWIDRRDLRQVVVVPRPAEVGPTERWLDIDLDAQVLTAYEGDRPVFATLVSTGKKKWETPTGVYRITEKAERRRMRADGPTEQWNVAAVPWTMTFRKNFALHGTYWHDGFGRQRSHGCVNLSPADAHRIFAFTTADPEPEGDSKNQRAAAFSAAAAGTTSPVAMRGTPVQLRRGKEQQPAWRDYKGRELSTLVSKR